MTRSRTRVDHQIPITSPEMFAAPYTDVPVDRSDPRGREPLVRLDTVGVAFESYYAKTDGKNPPFYCAVEGSRQDIWLRKSAAEKLGRINEMLGPYEAELFVFDGHRTVACQQGLWNFYYAKAKQENPNDSDEEHRRRARLFVVDPALFDENNPRTWLAHTNGAAVDLTLRDTVTGDLLEMGANIEVDADAAESAGDFFERELAAGRIDENDVRLQNRRLLHWAMTQEGFLNETARVFWHYDWGNQLFVRASRAFMLNPPAAAWYGYIDLPK